MHDHDGDSTPESPAALLDDPRIEPDSLRLLTDDDSSVLLIGVVHDHPASVYRVRRIVGEIAPDTVAVELPPLALPLFETTDEGGEMSAALRGSTADSAAIDAHGPRFVGAVIDEVRRRSPGWRTVGQIATNALSVGKTALRCRVASVRGRDAIPAPLVGTSFDLADDASDPATVAAHEQRHLSRSFSVLRAFERPAADEIVDAARERTMARSLARIDGRTVAVVGFEHLDGLTDELVARGLAERSVTADTVDSVLGE